MFYIGEALAEWWGEPANGWHILVLLILGFSVGFGIGVLWHILLAGW